MSSQVPVVISQDQIVLDGYAQWELARLQGRLTIPCLEYELGEEEALRRLVQSHRRSQGLNDFARILLALDLEPWLQERARSNQRTGGQIKGSSTLAKAPRLDVRSEIAAAAGVSTGNVTKVKQLVQAAHPNILQTLRLGEISIHRAWQWIPLSPAEQRAALQQFHSQRGVRKVIRGLVNRHRQKEPSISADTTDLVRLLRALESETIDSVSVSVVDAPGRTVFLTKDLFHSLGPQKELHIP